MHVHVGTRSTEGKREMPAESSWWSVDGGGMGGGGGRGGGVVRRPKPSLMYTDVF